MTKTFIIEKRYREKLGEIIFSDGKFEVKIFSEKEKRIIEEIIKDSLEKGISLVGMGEIMLERSLKIDDPLFFSALEDVFTRKGYIMIPKEQKKSE